MKKFDIKSDEYESHLLETNGLILKKHKNVDINILLNRVKVENKKKIKKKLIFLFCILSILGITFILSNS